MSWESTATYYRLLNEGVRDRLGGMHSARLVLYSVDFADVEVLQREGRWEEAGTLLADGARGLAAAGAEAIVICANTMHLVVDQVRDAGLPVLHIGDALAAAARAQGVTTLALLGTAYTMEQPFLRDHLAAAGIPTVVPDAAERADLQRIVFGELTRGVVEPASRERFTAIVDRLAREEGADAAALACTEFSLLVAAAELAIPGFDTTALHCAAALEWMLAADQTIRRSGPGLRHRRPPRAR
jgi:aspartate racemase